MTENQKLQIIQEKSQYHNYAFLFPFNKTVLDFCRQLKVKYGWQEFNFREGKWRFNLAAIITEIQQRFPDTEVLVEQEQGTELTDAERALMAPPVIRRFDAAMEMAKSDLLRKAQKIKKQRYSTIQQVKGLKLLLYDYQKVGVEFLTASGGRAILADSMGVGKTAQAIAFLVHNKIPKTLVICPASLKFAWESEVKKWSKLKPFVIDGKFWKAKGTAEGIQLLAEHDVIIVNFDLLKKFHNLLMLARFDCLVVDEFHAIKSTRAIRSKLTKQIASRIPKVILLSGTPMLNRPVELFNGLNIIDPRTWKSWIEYTKRYCDGHRDRFGWNVAGASNIEELKTKIAPYFLRRTKEEVLAELPPKTFIDIPVLLPPDVQKNYDAAEQDLARFLRDIKKKSAAEVSKALAAEKLVKLNELRQISTTGKLDTAKDLINQILENDEKVVVFSVYHRPLHELRDYYGNKAVLLTGETPTKERAEIVTAFQENPNVKIFLGGLHAAGVGLTLTAASNVIFIDFDWVPALMEQAADRIHRIGQKATSVNIYQIYAKDTIDDYMKGLLAHKQDLVTKLIEGQTPTDNSYLQLILKNFEEKYEKSGSR